MVKENGRYLPAAPPDRSLVRSTFQARLSQIAALI